MTPESLPCLIAVVVAFAAGAWADHVFRPARRVVDHRGRRGARPAKPDRAPGGPVPDPPPGGGGKP